MQVEGKVNSLIPNVMKKQISFFVGMLTLVLLGSIGFIVSCSTQQVDRPTPMTVEGGSIITDAINGPAFTDECVWKGVVFDRRAEGCGFVIKLEDEYQTVLVPVSMPFDDFRLFEGQIVELGYNIHGNQASTCMAGVLAEIFCIRQTGIDRGILNDKAPSPDDLVTE
jgi:hypothetical protein